MYMCVVYTQCQFDNHYKITFKKKGKKVSSIRALLEKTNVLN